MTIKEGREYRALQDFSLVPREEGSEEYRVKGTAVVFDTPTVIAEYGGIKYCEVIDRHAFDEWRLSQDLCKPPEWCRIEAPHRRF